MRFDGGNCWMWHIGVRLMTWNKNAKLCKYCWWETGPKNLDWFHFIRLASNKWTDCQSILQKYQPLNLCPKHCHCFLILWLFSVISLMVSLNSFVGAGRLRFHGYLILNTIDISTTHYSTTWDNWGNCRGYCNVCETIWQVHGIGRF